MAPASSHSAAAPNPAGVARSADSGQPSTSPSMRYDIEGLRGIAIALVVIFHVFIGRVSAGVDVFLLLGGIFFFSSQLANARNPKGLTLVQSLIRMLRRLFPLLVVVVASTLAASLLVMNRLVYQTMSTDAAASLGYVMNWRLAFSGREYAAVRTSVSPFQHLWSMSAQLQIYVASLLVITLIAVIFRASARRAVLIVVGVATVASFVYATYLGTVDQDLNYYSSLSRFWEIGLGGLVGLLILRRDTDSARATNYPAWLRRIMGVVGLLMIVVTGWVVDGASTFPGPWTLLPLGGALLVVLAGSSGTSVGLTRLLETRPLQFLGRISYALYLWHWPLLVLVLNYFDAPTVSPILGLSVIGASVGLAWLTHRFVETPLRQRKKPARSRVLTNPGYWKAAFATRPKAIYGSLIVVTALAVVASPVYMERRIAMGNEELWALAEERGLYPGAEAFLDGAHVPANMPLIPPLEDFERMLPPTQDDGCFTGFEGTSVVTRKDGNNSEEPCAYGDPKGKTLYVIGGSHSEHYLPALDLIGKYEGVKMVPILKMGCPINANVTLWNGDDYPDCREWSKKAMKFIKDNPPELGIFMTGTRPTTIAGDGPEIVPKEYVNTVKTFSKWGIHSYLIRDNPWHMLPANGGPMNMRTCVADMMEGKFAGLQPDNRGKDFRGTAVPGTPTPEEVAEINSVCGTAASESLQPVDPSIAAYRGLDVTLLDLTDAVCEQGWCPGIIGNMMAYRDAHHYTNIFAETMAPALGEQMFPAGVAGGPPGGGK